MLATRNCQWCDQLFQPKTGTQRFCCRRCALCRNGLLGRIVAGAESEEEKIRLVLAIRHSGVPALTPEDWQTIARCDKAHLKRASASLTTAERSRAAKKRTAKQQAAQTARLHAWLEARSADERLAYHQAGGRAALAKLTPEDRSVRSRKRTATMQKRRVAKVAS